MKFKIPKLNFWNDNHFVPETQFIFKLDSDKIFYFNPAGYFTSEARFIICFQINLRYIFNRLKDRRDRKHISSESNFARQPPADKTF